MSSRIQLVAVLASVLLLFVILELVRRRRLMERYALLWLLCAAVLLVLASWPDGLRRISRLIGIAYPPNALFFVALGFVLVLLLHFSSAISRLGDQTKALAQRQALLEERVQATETAVGRDLSNGAEAPADDLGSNGADAVAADPGSNGAEADTDDRRAAFVQISSD